MLALEPTAMEHYEDEGWIVPNHRLPSDLLSEFRQLVDDIIRDNPDIRPEDFRNLHLVGADGSNDDLEIARKFMRLATEPTLLDIVEDLIGPDILLWSSQILCKPGRIGMEVAWHQDGHFLPMRPLEACTVWIAIDDATPENGCMKFIPGSHKGGTLSHIHDDRESVVFQDTLDTSTFNESEAVYDALEAGQFSIHDVHLVHGSAANTSGNRRAAITLRYMPATAHWDREIMAVPTPGNRSPSADFAIRPIVLVRGQNRNPKNTNIHVMSNDGLAVSSGK